MVIETGAVPEGGMLKPGVGNSYGNGWRQLWKSAHFGWLLLIWVILMALGSVPSIFQGVFQPLVAGPQVGLFSSTDMIMAGAIGAVLGLFSLLYTVFFTNPLNYGVSYAFLKAARADNVSVEDMFACFKNYWNAVGASLLVGIILVVSFFFLVVPSIYLYCKLAFVPYLVIDRRMNLGDAFSTSWKMTKGHGWKIFLIGLLGIPISIAGFICLGVGVIIAWMWITLALASLYHAVSMEKGELANNEAVL